MKTSHNQSHQNKPSHFPQGDSPAPLIPGLPDHIAQLCLSTVHPILLHSVCRSWRRLIYSPTFPPFYSLYTLLFPKMSSGLINNFQEKPNSLEFMCFDPISSTWESLPEIPPLNLIHRHHSFISRTLPIQSLTISNNLLLMSGSDQDFLPALQRPLGFDPLLRKCFSGPPYISPRRWCIAGSAAGEVYVISGVGGHYRSDVARSVEKWVMKREEKDWRWEKMRDLKDGRFSREANEAVGYRGKLCMVNIKGNAAKEGAVYNILMNQWEEMPAGMLAGWNGPAAVDENQQMYVVDEATGTLSRYNPENDQWEELLKSPEHLKGAEQVASGRGRVCVVCAAGGTPCILVVDVVAKPARIFIVHPPGGMEVVAVHILPRMSHSYD